MQSTETSPLPGRIDGILLGGFALAAFAAAMLVLARAAAASTALVVALVPALLFGFIAIAARYPARAIPLRGSRALLLVTAHVGGALVAAALWVLALRSWSASVARFRMEAERAAGDGGLLALLFGVGMLLYLVAVVAHYLIAEVGASNRSRQAALRYEVLARESELKALRSQIDPHFLYNSLNAVASLCGSRPQDARRMSQLLADFFRRSLRLGALREIALSEEVSLVETYLAIEKIRFGERLELVTEIEPHASHAAVPSLILQPLVENSVRHGIASTLEGGAIRISARVEGASVVLKVENPTDPDRAHAAGEGVGIANVRGRLAALHGDASSVRTREEAGTFLVEVRFPMRQIEGGAS